MRSGYLFAGPSLTAEASANAAALGLTILAPIIRDDVASLVSDRKPATLVIADGRFDQTMAVGHLELREALARGWHVWGLSSMGAIRAYELRFLGMRGWGRVYEMFADFKDFQDDELALLHESQPPYRAASEPLVHLRMAAAQLAGRGLVSDAVASGAICSLKRLWYGDRTLDLFEELLDRGASRRQRLKIRRTLSDFDRFRIKQKDLAAFLATRSLWCVHGTSPV